MKKSNVKMLVAGTVLVETLATGLTMSGRSIDSFKGYIYNSVSFGVAYASEYVKTEILGMDPEIESENIRYGFETAETEDGYAEGYQFGIFDMSVNDKDLYIDAQFTNVENKLGDVEIVEKDGIVNIEVKIIKVEDTNGESLPLKINKTFKNSIKTVYLGGDIIYDEGVCIGEDAASMYKYKLESVADVSATKKLVYGVAVGQREFFSVLDVAVEGKDIKVKMHVVGDSLDNVYFECDSPLILALAKDAESVTWTDEEGKVVYKATIQDMDKSVKKAGESAVALHKYIEDTHISPLLSY